MNTPDSLSELNLEIKGNPPVPGAVDLLEGYEYGDVGNGQRVIALQGERLHYCHGFKKWLIWDSRRWRIDESDAALLLAEQTMKEFASQAIASANGELRKLAIKSLDWPAIRNALRLAQSHVPVLPDELDKDPDLLNFKNGTLNLKTGELRPHCRKDLITKLVQHEYWADAKCPTFFQFLEKIMGGGNPDAEPPESCKRLVDYLQTAFGYSLTGHTREKAVFLLHGLTDTGKTTLLDLFRVLLKEYASKIQIETLMVHHQESNNAQADLADLRGARYVMTSETEEGQRLSEGKLKRISQGLGTIKAIRKYENPIEFPETHKLWIDCNYLPKIRSMDDAIWRRLLPIPFAVKIAESDEHGKLQSKLVAELHSKLVTESPGILAWAVAGAKRWYEEGLRTPLEVKQKRETYRDDSDSIKRFLEEECERDEGLKARARRLYLTYRAWAEKAHERIVHNKDFSKALIEKGFPLDHDQYGNYYEGIGLPTKQQDLLGQD